LDALTEIVWQDDKQIVRMTVSKAYDKVQPWAEIAISIQDNPLLGGMDGAH
jgi:Holliday junction resolvase RusA-like endonuclease